MNKAGLDLLMRFEGFRSNAYLDIAGVPTIGFGFTEGVKLGDTITLAEATARLATEVHRFEDRVLALCSNTPTPDQLAAFTCFAYNIGVGGFAGSTALRMHNAGNYTAAGNALLMWDKCRGLVVPGLLRRREAERALYLGLE